MIRLFIPKRLGKVCSYSNQYIETSFLFFLIPLQSYFININSKETIEIPLNKISLKNYYVSFILVFFPIVFFFLWVLFTPNNSYAAHESNNYLGYMPAILAGILITIGLIYSFRGGKPAKYEIKKRTIFQSIVELNALPEWLSLETAKNIYEKHSSDMPANWKDKILNEEFTTDEFFYYYTMLSYQNRIMPTHENSELLNSLDKRLHKE
jgi:hypothetical protein